MLEMMTVSGVEEEPTAHPGLICIEYLWTVEKTAHPGLVCIEYIELPEKVAHPGLVCIEYLYK